MILSRPPLLIVVVAGFLFLSSCNTRDKKTEIESAMKTYERLVLKMDADSIPLMYTPDGNMNLSHGRTWIKRTISSFPNAKMLYYFMTSDSIRLNVDTAFQYGKYRMSFTAFDTTAVNGIFKSKWIWMKGEGWKIQSMITTPDNTTKY